MRFVPVILIAAVLASPALAEDAKKPAEPGPWKLGSTLGLNLSQSSFSTNWAGGDKGSIVWVLNTNTTAERQFTKTFNLQNVLQLAYGQTTRQVVPDAAKPDERVWDEPDKTTDQIAFESTGRFTFGGFVDPYLGLRLDSQFRDESFEPIGTIDFNPVKLKESAGIARVLEKTDDKETITRLGFGFRQTLAKSFTDPVAKTKASYTTNDGGLEWVTTATRPMFEKKVLYKGSLLVFQPVFYSKSDALEQFDARVKTGEGAVPANPAAEAVADFWKATDVNWQNTFTAQITKHIGVTLFAQWVYDKFDAAANVDPKLPLAVQIAEVKRNTRKAGQFKETLALSFTYALF